MRGEKFGKEADTMMAMGSPPHARGKVCGGIRGYAVVGITPACAGKSILSAHIVLLF